MQKLPRATKELHGTYRADREPVGVQAHERVKVTPSPPDGMSELAKTEWLGLAPILVAMGVLSGADVRSLVLLCETLATATELETTIRDEGFTMETGSGGRKAHPALKSLESTRNAAARLMGDFGLSPKARKYVTKAPAPASDNPYSRFSHLED